jgi:hypothetical protein
MSLDKSQTKENKEIVSKFQDTVLPWFEKIASKGTFVSR